MCCVQPAAKKLCVVFVDTCAYIQATTRINLLSCSYLRLSRVSVVSDIIFIMRANTTGETWLDSPMLITAPVHLSFVTVHNIQGSTRVCLLGAPLLSAEEGVGGVPSENFSLLCTWPCTQTAILTNPDF